MALDYYDLQSMRKNHPAWRLLTADNAPLIAGFLDAAFREENLRTVSESDLTVRLEDFLFQLRESEEAAGHSEAFPRDARTYLDEWAHVDKGWLRKFYPPDSDEPHYDLTPATETALQWMDALFQRGFVGTESRLYTSLRLLREIVSGVEQDKTVRIRELKKERERINHEIKAVEAGEVPLLNPRELRERFVQFSRTARELLGDFRAVEHNFRELDRTIREEIAGWTGDKGEMLSRFFGEHDAITQSDQGESFRAFWDFLMSPSSQEELTQLLDRVYEIGELGDTLEDRRMRRIHFDWMSAGEQTQRTAARLSQRLRSYLDDRAYYENRRIIEILNSLEKKALALRSRPPSGIVMELDNQKPELKLPMERPLFSPPPPTELSDLMEAADEEELDPAALFQAIIVDKKRLQEQIALALADKSQITLAALLTEFPLQEGLAELVTYFSLAAEGTLTGVNAHIDEAARDRVRWTDREGTERQGNIPRIIFTGDPQ